jgi:hypothetical protein
MVVFDSRILHAGMQPLQGRPEPKFRLVVYTTMTPWTKAKEKRLHKALTEGRMTNHNVARLFPKHPRTRGSPLPDLAPLPPTTLSTLGEKLLCKRKRISGL